jgi:internalin A
VLQGLPFAEFGAKIMIFSVHRLIVCSAIFLLIGCKQNPYTVTFNNNVVYSPSAAIRDKVLDDPALQACLNQVMASAAIEDLEDVTLIACPAAGITTLGGIEKLINLEQLDVSDNAISNVSPLLSLKKLRVLGLRNNAISNVGSLVSMPLLRFISLSGNSRISCRDVDALENKLGNTFDKPLTCVD